MQYPFLQPQQMQRIRSARNFLKFWFHDFRIYNASNLQFENQSNVLM